MARLNTRPSVQTSTVTATATAANKPDHDDGKGGGADVAADIARRLQNIEQHTGGVDQILEDYRLLWQDYQVESDPECAAVEQHPKHEQATRRAQALFDTKYKSRHTNKDIRSNVIRVQSEHFEWHESLQGLRLYAHFGQSGLTKLFLTRLRELASMRAHTPQVVDDSVVEGELEQESAQEQGHGHGHGHEQEHGHGHEQVRSRAESNVRGGERGVRHGKGLTFTQALQLMKEARHGRTGGGVESRGAGTSSCWRPLDCRRAALLATERYGMHPHEPLKLKTKRKRMTRGKRNAESESDADTGSTSGDTSEIEGGEKIRNMSRALGDGIGAGSVEDVEKTGHDGRAMGDGIGFESVEGAEDTEGAHCALYNVEGDGVDISTHTDRTPEQRRAAAGPPLSDQPDLSLFSFQDGCWPEDSPPLSQVGRGPAKETPTPTPRPARQLRLPLNTRTPRTRLVPRTPVLSHQTYTSPVETSPTSPTSSHRRHPPEPDLSAVSPSPLSTSFPHAARLDIPRADMDTRRRKHQEAATAAHKSRPPSLSDSQGPVSTFKRRRLDGATSTDHLTLAEHFLAAFLGPRSIKTCPEHTFLLVHDTDANAADAPSFLIVVPPSTRYNGHDDQEQNTWLAVLVLLYADGNHTMVEVFTTSSPSRRRPKRRVREALDNAIPASLAARVQRVSDDDWTYTDMPVHLDLRDQDPSGYVKSLAVACCLLCNIDPPRQIFVWAWLGALAAMNASRTRLTAIEDATEPPELPPSRESAPVFGLSSLGTMASALKSFKASLVTLGQEIDLLGKYLEQLNLIRECADSVVPQAGVTQDTADLEKKVECYSVLLSTLRPDDPELKGGRLVAASSTATQQDDSYWWRSIRSMALVARVASSRL